MEVDKRGTRKRRAWKFREGYLTKRRVISVGVPRELWTPTYGTIDCRSTKRTPGESSWGQAGSFAGARRSLTDVLLCQLKKRFMNFSGFPAPLIPFTRSSSLARGPADPSTPLQTCFETWSMAQSEGSQRNMTLLFMHFTRGTPFSGEVQIKE